MSRRRVCSGVIVNPKHSELGRQCKRWAANGSDFCGVHGGGSGKNLLSEPEGLERRCAAKAHKTGERCRNQAIKGGTVCRFHGGAAGHVQKKARERLQELVDPAIVELHRILAKPDTSDSDRLRAVQMIFDRTGYGPGHFVEVEVRPWEVIMQNVYKSVADTGIIKEVPEDMKAELEAAREAQAAYGMGRYEDIQDAEVVEDDDPDNVTRITSARTVIRGSAEPPRRNR